MNYSDRGQSEARKLQQAAEFDGEPVDNRIVFLIALAGVCLLAGVILTLWRWYA